MIFRFTNLLHDTEKEKESKTNRKIKKRDSTIERRKTESLKVRDGRKRERR